MTPLSLITKTGFVRMTPIYRKKKNWWEMKNLLVGVRITAYARSSFLDPDYGNQTNTKITFAQRNLRTWKENSCKLLLNLGKYLWQLLGVFAQQLDDSRAK